MFRPGLFLHGGAGGRISPERVAAIRRSLEAVCESSFRRLTRHSALATVVFAVRTLEDNPLFNAGTGSVLQQDGRVRMSASVMDGARRRFAAVSNIEGVRNPVCVAQALLAHADRVLEGRHASRFAHSSGHGAWNPATPERRRQWRRRLHSPHGTVGAVAVDMQGRLAAATSTGGKLDARAGRVSDSGTPAGNYADANAAVSCTGMGEEILEEALAARLIEQVAQGVPLPRALEKTFRDLTRRRRRLAAIGLTRRGELSWASTLPILYAVGRTGRRMVLTF